MSNTTVLVGAIMKTINSKENSSVKSKIFINKNTSKQCGFAGMANVYDTSIYIDTRDGTGYDQAINKFGPLINKLATKYKFNGNTIDDTKHDVIIHILEGMKQYDPRKNMKLSTFIEMRASQRIINNLRKQCQLSNNATFVNLGLYSVICSCGYTFSTQLTEIRDVVCNACGEPIDSNRFTLVGLEETLESSEHIEEDLYMFNRPPTDLDEDVIFRHDMSKIIQKEDHNTQKLVELIYCDGLSTSAAAKKIGMSSVGADFKLKRLARKRKIREVFGK